MVEGRISPHASRQLSACVHAQGESADRGGKHVAGDRHQSIRHRDRPEARQCEDDGRSRGQHRERQNDRAVFGAGHVDRGADRRLHRKPEQTADGRDETDFRLAPVLLGDQEDVQVGAQSTADIRQQEIDGIE